MPCDDKQETKLTRYSGFTEKQNIQFNDNGQPLFPYGSYIVYVNENKNKDICVTDNKAKAVVVVTQAGKFRFKYTGPPANAFSKESFDTMNITIDNQGRILTADHCNHRIHIIDQDGQFLHYTLTTVIFAIHVVYARIQQTTSLWPSLSEVKLRKSDITYKKFKELVNSVVLPFPEDMNEKYQSIKMPWNHLLDFDLRHLSL